MLRAVADTHALIWYLAADSRLSAPAKATFDEAAALGQLIGISTITLVEILYLEEKGRLPKGLLASVREAMADPASPLAELSLDREVVRSMERISRDEVPDMPDRIIAGTALAANVPLISRDRKIRISSAPTIW